MSAAAARPQLKPKVDAAVKHVREGRAKKSKEPIGKKWTIEDHLAALRYRASKMKIFGIDLCQAASRCFEALWPDEEPPRGTLALANRLSESHARLCEWRESAARVGSDQAMTFVLSCYENLELDRFARLRGDSKWILNPEYVEHRKRTAYSFVPYANVHQFREDPYVVPEPAQEVEEEGEESGGEEDDNSLGLGSDDEDEESKTVQSPELPSASSHGADD